MSSRAAGARRRVGNRVHLALLTALLVALAACSSGSSGGHAAATDSPTAGAVDRAAVDAVLDDVVRGLHAATALPAHAPLSQVQQALQSAASSLGGAGQSLDATPAGVPQTLAVPIAAKLDRLSHLLDRAASCLAQTSSDAVAKCLPPLRRAEASDAALAHQLVSLAAYSSQSPSVFEHRLVRALQRG